MHNLPNSPSPTKVNKTQWDRLHRARQSKINEFNSWSREWHF